MSVRSEELLYNLINSVDGAGVVTTIAVDVTVDNTAGGVVLLAANTARKKLIVQNTGAQPMRVNFGSDPTTTTGLQMPANTTREFGWPYPITSEVKAIREGGTNTTATAMEIA